MRRFMLAALCLAAIAAPCAALAAPTDWPQFRGPGALGSVEDDPKLPDVWDAKTNVDWVIDIPGLAWSSPIVAGDKVFVTTCIAEGDFTPPKKGLYFGGENKTPPGTKHKWVVYGIDFKTGKIVWEKTVKEVAPDFIRHIKNTYASETPVTDGERVYAYFGNVGLYVFDLDGNPVWDKSWDTVKTRFNWGTAASPALHNGKIYIVNDNDSGSFLTAMDAKTGKMIWRVDRHDEKTNWATPYIWENEKRTEIVTPGTVAVRSYDLDGNQLWTLKGMSSITIATPYSKFGLLYVSSGYVGDKVRPFYAIKPGATGDISLEAGKKSNDFIAWSHPQTGPYNPTSLIYGDLLYVLYDRGFLGCFDAKTGEPHYEKNRLSQATQFTSSPWAYNGKIFCLSEDGVTYVLPAGKEFKIERENNLDEMCMATPAIAKSSLLLRTQSKLYKIVNKGEKTVEKAEEKPAEKPAIAP